MRRGRRSKIDSSFKKCYGIFSMPLKIYLHPGLPATLKSQIRAQLPEKVTVTSEIFSGDYGIRLENQSFFAGQFALHQQLILVQSISSLKGPPCGSFEFMLDTLCLAGGSMSLNHWLETAPHPVRCAS